MLAMGLLKRNKKLRTWEIKMSKKSGKLLRNRERSECEAKLVKLGLDIPWK